MDIFFQGLKTSDVIFQSEVKNHAVALAKEEIEAHFCFY